MPSLKTSTWMSREADPCCRAQTLQEKCRLIQISLPSHMWTELRHKTMISPSLIKQNKSTFNCPIQLPRRGVPNVQNEANNSSNMPPPHVEDTNNNNVNMDQPHGFDSSSIPYEEA